MDKKHQRSIEHIFDSYCKSIIKHEGIDLQRKKLVLLKKEVSLEQLIENGKFHNDQSFESDIDFDQFKILNETIAVHNDQLGEALLTLNKTDRNIIFLFYYFEFKDREIANLLGISLSGTWYRRKRATKYLKSYLGGDA
ncbi:RNA polymerase sigma factor [Enterococcus dispar]|uniref:RNA polymerase sigma factor n=1 Tax=Enterococcus dispar TaxID=44009 RepID=UPI002493272E|nr:sigma-70 family RNA polymerase sigma factor [Enterococcus dispar]